MDKIARRVPGLIRIVSYFGIVIGFLGIALIAFTLVNNIYKSLIAPEAVPGVALVLPIQVKGVFFVPFFYWIISIFVLAIVHELSHGVVARLHKIRVKFSGFAFIGVLLPIIPAAFVEPDEKQLRKKPAKQQLAVFAAGSFANIVFGFIVLALFILVAPVTVSSFVKPNGVVVTGFAEGFPAADSGLSTGDVITAVDNTPIKHLDNFTAYLQTKKPGDNVIVATKNASYPIALAANPEDKSKGYLGVFVTQNTELKQAAKQYSFVPAAIFWVLGLMYWVYVLNIGIGLFNLVPIAPLDGGRMVQLVMKEKFKLRGEKAAQLISALFIFLVAFNLIFSFV
jgi:membrane-associated protease RseP (regulator of RpoE activity)